jgi:predicted phage-related endonuclease
MIRYYHDLEQGTDDWYKIRLGKVTASEVNTLITPAGKLAKNQKIRDFACEIAVQRESMTVEDSFQSFSMLRGHLQEAIARDIYSDNFDEVKECGFITNSALDVVIGCSPDGLVGENGMIEIKSRIAKHQVATIISDEVPTEYVNQIQTALMVSGREWIDFVSYSNGLPLFVKRVLPDLERMELITDAINAFDVDVEAIRADYVEKSSKLVQTEWTEFMPDDEISESK